MAASRIWTLAGIVALLLSLGLPASAQTGSAGPTTSGPANSKSVLTGATGASKTPMRRTRSYRKARRHR